MTAEEILAQATTSAGILPSAAWIQHLVDLGVLMEQEKDRYNFSHIAIEEYFAARKIAEQPAAQIVADIAARTLDPRWAEILSLAIAYINAEKHQPTQAGLIWWKRFSMRPVKIPMNLICIAGCCWWATF